jgi:UPF0755 protein
MAGAENLDMSDLYDQELAETDDAEYEELRPELSRRRKVLVVVLGIFTVLTLIAGSIGVWAYRQLHPSSAPGEEVLIEVPSGSSTNAIADLLEKKGVIGSAVVFKLWLKLKSAGPFNAGGYNLHKNEDADVVLAALRAGPLPPPAKRFTVPPGLTKREIADQVLRSIPALSIDKLRQAIAEGGVLSQVLPDITDLEGLLFPDTYEIAQGADELAVVRVMVAQFDKVAAEVKLADASGTVGLDPYQVLIVASLIEEEAKVDEDRPKIARVIYNRLEQGIPLGVDATLCYLKEERPCVLRQSELAEPGPYNTRLVRGLPPTPIASPGRASLEAALNPAEGDWIFYVLDPDLDPKGTRHLFTNSAAEFEQAKARCKAANLGCG